MSIKYLNQILTYFSKVYHFREKIKSIKDGRVKPQVDMVTISFILLMGFMIQVPSFNRLEKWIKNNKFKKLLPRKSKMPSIDTVTYALDKVDLDSLNNFNTHIVKTTIKNKVFRYGTIDGYKVSAIDGVELFESTKKCCEDCLTREYNDGMHYFHRSVVCMTVGSDPHIILGQEMLEPKKDGSDKDEGELTAGKRLIKNLYNEYNHFADIIVADALYMKSTWIQQLLDLGIDSVIRAKDERLHIVKDALGIFRSREADNKWIALKTSTKTIEVTAWDEDNFEMTNLGFKIRFLRFLEKITIGDKIEFNEIWIITTNKNIDNKTLWKIIHNRWHIENNGFHQLKCQWNLKHCYFHSPTGIEAVMMFIIISFNLMQLFFFRCLRRFREKKMLQIDIIEDLRDDLAVISRCPSNMSFIT
ncbi:MAG: transposase [Clostridiales bacterium]|nr:transposase [Clostridiales bacterium]